MSDERDYGAAYTTPDDYRECVVGDSEGWFPNHQNWPPGWIPAKVEPGELDHRPKAPPFYHRGQSYESDYEEQHAEEPLDKESIL